MYVVVKWKVEIHYYGRLAAKQGWRFDSTYEHKDEYGDPSPFVFVLGSGKVSLILDHLSYGFIMSHKKIP